MDPRLRNPAFVLVAFNKFKFISSWFSIDVSSKIPIQLLMGPLVSPYPTAIIDFLDFGTLNGKRLHALRGSNTKVDCFKARFFG